MARIALGQINPTVGDIEANAERILRVFKTAAAEGAGLVAVGELALTGYPPEDLLLRPEFVEKALVGLDALAREAPAGLTAVVGCITQTAGNELYNSAAVISGGEIKAVCRKRSLPNYGVFDERRYFLSGDGFVNFHAGGVEFGVVICEDLWDPGGPHLKAAAGGASLIVSINASPYSVDKHHERLKVMRSAALATGAACAYVNLVGGQDELVFDGGSTVVDASGRLIAAAPRFTEDLTVFELPSGEPAGDLQIPAGDASGPDPEEVYSALVLGTRDYLRKNGFFKAVVAVSGGIDSALTACIAVDALGAENVMGLFMPSSFTSDESGAYVHRLAESLGIELVTLPIEGPADEMRRLVSSAKQAGATEGATDENLQARVRGNLAMAISNQTGRMLLSTGNKSEMAVGYATLYGDMAGGFAVLKDVPKTLVYQLSRWCNTRGEVIDRAIIDRPPTAELRPGQLDSDTLPPYDLLDPILQAYVEHDRSEGEIVAMGYDRETVRTVLKMVDRAEYKRRQAPPGPKITERAFGRDRRFPITNRFS